MMASKLYSCLLVTSLLALAAAARDAKAQSKSCSLMTQQTAAGIFGGPVAAGRVEMATAGADDCRFDAPNGGFAEIGIIDPKGMGISGAEMFKITTSQKNPGRTIQQVPGLGDAAVIDKGANDTSLSVLVHGKILMVTATQAKNPGLSDALIAAAKQALGKV